VSKRRAKAKSALKQISAITPGGGATITSQQAKRNIIIHIIAEALEDERGERGMCLHEELSAIVRCRACCWRLR
jgi:hypothetical protein